MPLLNSQQSGPIGLGLMGLTWRPNPCSQEQAFDTLRASIESGGNFWNGGEFYGPSSYNSLVLLDQYFEKYPEDAEKVVLSIKGGLNPQTGRPDGSAENTRRTIEDSIAQLKGRKKINLFEMGRRDRSVNMKETFDVMNHYVETGKIGGVSLSEVRAETIHEAVKHTKVQAVEVELSLFTPDVLYNGIAAACAAYGIPLIAYSPIGRGMLTGQLKTVEDLPDRLKNFPRYQGDNFKHNLELVSEVERLAEKKGCTAAQFAINWVRALSGRLGMPVIIPIPGATSRERVVENMKVVELSEEDMLAIDEILARFKTAGDRYPDSTYVNT